LPTKKETLGKRAPEYSPFGPLSALQTYKSICTLIETRTGSWKILKANIEGIKFPASVTDLSKTGKYWAVEFRPCERQLLGVTIPSKTLKVPLPKALQLGDRDMFSNRTQLLGQLMTTARSMNYSEVAETLRESLRLTA